MARKREEMQRTRQVVPGARVTVRIQRQLLPRNAYINLTVEHTVVNKTLSHIGEATDTFLLMASCPTKGAVQMQHPPVQAPCMHGMRQPTQRTTWSCWQHLFGDSQMGPVHPTCTSSSFWRLTHRKGKRVKLGPGQTACTAYLP
jgi:hypothetical protein